MLEGLISDPVTLDELSRRFQGDVWGGAVEDAVFEYRIERRSHGPIELMLVGGEPEEPRFNLLLGASRPGAVRGGHLADALKALGALGVDHRVPVLAGLDETEAAEETLRDEGYEPVGRRAVFVRDAEPPQSTAPATIEVDELSNPDIEGEGYSQIATEGAGLEPFFATFYFELPAASGWRCYAAIEDGIAIGCGAMRIDEGFAQLGLDATLGSGRGRGAQSALIQRRIADAAAAGCHTLFAETDEAPVEGGEPSPAARNLARAGFERVGGSAVWAPARKVNRFRTLTGTR